MPRAIHSFTNDALGTSDAIELSQRLRRREVSPSELADAAICRAKSINQDLNCIEANCFEKPNVNPLHLDLLFSGVPTFVKDNIPVKGFPTTFGSAAVSAESEKRNDPYADQFLKLGVTLLGKSSLPEFGLNATTEPSHKGPTPNPWNVNYSAGASSGGAGALVASGVVPIAHGNDGGGSIRIPAACCGLIGLKPTRGRHINSTAAKALPINIVSEGILSRSVRDTAYFHFEAEKIYRNKKLPPLPLITGPSKTRMKIGVLHDSVTGVETDSETREMIERSARLLDSLGHTVQLVSHPLGQQFSDDFAHYWAMMAFALSKTGKLAFNQSFCADRLDDLTKGLASYYRKQALRTPLTILNLKKHSKKFLSTFKDIDLLLTPTLGHTPAPLGHLNPKVPYEELFERLRAYVGFTPPANVSGAPAISLPGSFSREGTPIGLQLIADLGREDRLIEVAYQLESNTNWQQLYSIKQPEACQHHLA